MFDLNAENIGKVRSELDSLTELVKEVENKMLENKKHSNGYAYDSLVYRYQLARYKACEVEIRDLQIKNISRAEAEARAHKEAKRDILRFCEILDDVMEEHD